MSNWTIKQDENAILWLHLNVPKTSTNVLSQEVIKELSNVLFNINRLIASDEGFSSSYVPYDTFCYPEGLVITSDKQSGFIAGADINEFLELETIEDGKEFLRNAHDVFNELESLNIPTVAMIDGFCLGGGLELALACDYRVVTNRSSLGFPEIKLGIFPGFGGTMRSVRLLGSQTAMNLMLTGRNVRAKAAKKLGLVDVVTDPNTLNIAVIDIISKHPTHKSNTLQKAIDLPLVKSVVANKMRKEVAKNVNPQHYPAPFVLIDHWERTVGNEEAMLESEIENVPNILVNNSEDEYNTSLNLIRTFFLQEQLKSQGKATNNTIKHVHVIGAGVMGGDIAAWCALQGMTVTIQDQKPEHLSNMMKRTYKLFNKKLKKPILIAQAIDRIVPDIKGNGVSKADLVIEAIFENLEVKQELYKSLEPQMKESAILATNTSSIKLEDLVTVLEKPERLVGLHFFNPVAQMQLVEVIHIPETDNYVIQQVCDFTRKINKLPLKVKSCPGFLINRVLMPYLMKAIELFEAGVQRELIDAAAKEYGMPMGPLELADVVGLDICLHVGEILAKELNLNVPLVLKQMVDDSELGKKSGSGFYTWVDGKKQTELLRFSPEKYLQDQLIQPLIDECKLCVDEGIVDSSDLLDAGVIFGTGFAPHLGGPLKSIGGYDIL